MYAPPPESREVVMIKKCVGVSKVEATTSLCDWTKFLVLTVRHLEVPLYQRGLGKYSGTSE